MIEADMPRQVLVRARNHRARLGPAGHELTRLDHTEGEGPPSSATMLLAVGLLPSDAQTLLEVLDGLRRSADHAIELRIIDWTSTAVPFRGRLRRRARGERTDSSDRDLVGVVRRAGWTVTAIERFGADDGRTWVDLVAKDLGTRPTVEAD